MLQPPTRDISAPFDHLLDLALAAWIAAKFENTGSVKTRTAYTETITAFRSLLQGQRLDLAWVVRPGETELQVRQLLAFYAEQFASMRLSASRHKGKIAPSTKNQRLAILSSFYQFANKRGFLTIGNPVELVDRSPVEAYGKAQALDQDEVQARLAQIDVTTKQGLRDMALLLVLLSTGRRANEVADLRRRHIQISRRRVVTLSFERLKGAKSTCDTLDDAVGLVLVLWMEMVYEKPFVEIAEDAPLWMDLHHPTRVHQALHYQGIAGIVAKYLGTSKVHVTRHTFAMLMLALGAKLTDIQRLLLHSNAATTGLYLDTMSRGHNPFASRLSALLGVSSLVPRIGAPHDNGVDC